MYQRQENDELKARFTKWVKVVAYRARINYLRANKKWYCSISLDEVTEEHPIFGSAKIEDAVIADNFDFEEERLAQAFSKLPPVKKKVLTMLFVLEEPPEEVARELGCTVQNVYNQRSLALKRLRAAMEGGDDHE